MLALNLIIQRILYEDVSPNNPDMSLIIAVLYQQALLLTTMPICHQPTPLSYDPKIHGLVLFIVLLTFVHYLLIKNLAAPGHAAKFFTIVCVEIQPLAPTDVTKSIPLRTEFSTD